MTTSAEPRPAAPVKYKRSIKNYLLDARFQLKWTGRIIFVALFISALMGFLLFRTSDKLTEQSQQVIAQGEKQIAESETSAKIVAMQMAEKYADEPALAKNFKDEEDKRMAALQQQRDDLKAQALKTAEQQTTMKVTLVAGLLLLVVLIGILGIFFTHKVVGPIHMMKILLRQVGDGKLNFHRKPRKGDELQDFFQVFAEMVEKLKARQAEEVKTLEAAMAEAKATGASDAAIAKIALVRDEMQAALGK
ncbi:MAG: hypothetical protein KIT84_18205 [Labilithrix sp.]|nr:hypothetical protein [Labilithrix sp.]MCW5812966.1 hypothetical protein [Labilithrix sp.]